MKLIELVSIYETLLESRVEPIETLLESRLKPTIPSIFTPLEVLVTEHFNNKGNYSLIVRVTLEHSGNLIKEELENYSNTIMSTMESVTKSLLESKNTLFNHRSSIVKLL
jgi:hypothetical protein